MRSAHTISRTLLTSLGLMAGAFTQTSTHAQSFNIDIDFVNALDPAIAGAPSAAFPGAAGQTGFWNAADSYQLTPIPLSSLANTATSATLTMTSNAPNGFAHWAFSNGSNTGDYAKLLNDCHIVNNSPGPYTNTYTFNGLTPGTYQVFTYGVRPLTGTSATRTLLSGGSPQIVAGPMPGNAFALGITHSIDTVTISGSTLSVTVDRGPSASGAGAYINGFQLVHNVPAPGACAAFGVAGLASLRRRRR